MGYFPCKIPMRKSLYLQYVSHTGPGDVMKLGYARVSTDDQTLDIQCQKLTAAGCNGLFQAARARARGYRNTATFACIIYLLGAPIDAMLDVFHST
jgi:hypothetical protein